MEAHGVVAPEADEELHKQHILSSSERPIESDDSFARAQINFDFKASVPRAWHSLLNGRGQVVWRFERTPIVRILGAERGSMVHKLISTSWFRLLVYSAFNVVVTALMYLGTFKLVSDGWMISGAVGNMLWLILSMLLSVDTHIVISVSLNFGNAVSMFFSLVLAITLGYLFEWDLRGRLIAGPVVLGALTLALQETMPLRARKLVVVPANLALLLTYTFIVIAMNLGLFPETNTSRPLVTVTVPGRPPVDISALGIFTQATTAAIVVLARNLYVFGSALRRHQSTRLPSASIFLESVDDPEAEPHHVFAALSILDKYV